MPLLVAAALYGGYFVSYAVGCDGRAQKAMEYVQKQIDPTFEQMHDQAVRDIQED